MASNPPIMRCTKPSKSLTASPTGSKPASTFSPVSSRKAAGSGSAITFPRGLRSPKVALAGRAQPLAGIWLPAAQFFSRHLDLGDPAYPRQDHGPLVFLLQSDLRARLARRERAQGF